MEPGDTPSGIAEKEDVDLQELLEANPDIDPDALTVGEELKLPCQDQSSRRAVFRDTAAHALLTLALAAPAQAAEPDIDSPSAIVMEAGTGDVIYEKAPTSAARWPRRRS